MEAKTPARSTEQFPLAAIPGDYATGLRARSDGVGPIGDFATGIQRAAMTQSTGDFATGLRSSQQRTAGLGDFATGMRAHHAVHAAPRHRPASGGLRRLQERTDPVT